MKALLGQWKADMIRTSRDRRYLLLLLAMPVILYLIYAKETAGLQTKMAGSLSQSAYFMVSMIAFGVIGSSVNTLSVRLAAERQNGWTSFLRTTPMSSVTYSLSKALTQWTLTLATIIIVFLVAHFLKGVNLSWSTWITVGAWLWLASLPFAVLGILIGMTGSSAQVLGTLIFIALALLGGLMGGMSGPLQDLDKWLPTHYFVQPGWDLLQGKSPDMTDIAMLAAYTVLFVIISAILQKGSLERINIKNKRMIIRISIIGIVLLWFLYRHQII